MLLSLLGIKYTHLVHEKETCMAEKQIVLLHLPSFQLTHYKIPLFPYSCSREIQQNYLLRWLHIAKTFRFLLNNDCFVACFQILAALIVLFVPRLITNSCKYVSNNCRLKRKQIISMDLFVNGIQCSHCAWITIQQSHFYIFFICYALETINNVLILKNYMN